ncbi:hypothetical protein BZA77DRAFT_341278 [Pyronema omphalodes]|nr:hypothetical protein BZA77DRAFT_341278 [Pyronema omphalodes]
MSCGRTRNVCGLGDDGSRTLQLRCGCSCSWRRSPYLVAKCGSGGGGGAAAAGAAALLSRVMLVWSVWYGMVWMNDKTIMCMGRGGGGVYSRADRPEEAGARLEQKQEEGCQADEGRDSDGGESLVRYGCERAEAQNEELVPYPYQTRPETGASEKRSLKRREADATASPMLALSCRLLACLLLLLCSVWFVRSLASLFAAYFVRPLGFSGSFGSLVLSLPCLSAPALFTARLSLGPLQ